MIHAQPFGAFFRGALVVGVLFIALCFEYLYPLRKTTQSKAKRVVINICIAAVAGVVLRFLFFPIVYRISQHAIHQKWGVLHALDLPAPLNLILALLALDYTLYIWHRMNHSLPFLWRFHNAHHTDLDLDVSTASRFHFGELILSTAFRSAQIVILGIDPFTLVFFETVVTMAAQFYHSNIKLPLDFERVLNYFLVTPRMHGIHHSIVLGETNSNYSTIFSFWDRLHHSVQLNVPQIEITIGVPAYRSKTEVGFIQTLLSPFRRQRPWQLPDGTVPQRKISEVNPLGCGYLVN